MHDRAVVAAVDVPSDLPTIRIESRNRRRGGPCLTGDKAAINCGWLTGHERRGIRDEPDDCFGDLARLAQAADRVRSLHGRPQSRMACSCRRKQRRLDDAWADGIRSSGRLRVCPAR